MPVFENPQAAALRKWTEQMTATVQALQAEVEALRRGGGTLEDAIDAIPGRRVLFNLVASQLFTTSNDGTRASALTFEVSQDGPFVMTHYPLAMWKTTLPTNATDFGLWRPVSTWPLADQVVDTNIIDISYELEDSGSGRSLQNSAVPAGLLSRPDNMIPLPKPMLFRPQSVISFIPTYENIAFGGSTASTEGRLVITLPGYKIVNLG